tara:strand:+ start:1920 stop:2828 length:909 start_codon:yes stop_codon:yes gene_type:complete
MNSFFKINLFFIVSLFSQTNIVVEWEEIELNLPHLRSEWIPNQAKLFLSNDNQSSCFIFDPISGGTTLYNIPYLNAFNAKWSPNGKFVLILKTKYNQKRRMNSLILVDQNGVALNTIIDFTMKKIIPVGWSGKNTLHYLIDNKLKSYSIDNKNLEWNYPIVYAIGNMLFKKDNSTSAVLLKQFPTDILNLSTSYSTNLIVFELYGGSLFSFDLLTSKQHEIGVGNAPSISPSGDYILFMRLKDNGHELTDGDIFKWDKDSNSISQLTNTDDQIEMNPSISSDGHFISITLYPQGELIIGTIQ